MGTTASDEIGAPAISKRSNKRAKLIAAASMQINERGVDGIDLAQIAREQGFTRNALYYYVRDTRDLAQQCFDKACVVRDDDLTAALQQGKSPSERIQHFVRLSLAPRADPIVGLNGIEFLAEADREGLLERSRATHAMIASVFDEGIKAGVFKSTDPMLAAYCLTGMIDWIRIAPRWLGQRPSESLVARLADRLVDLLMRGFAATNAVLPDEFPRYSEDAHNIANVFDKAEIGRQKRAQLLGTASNLFNQRGIAGTSLTDIAQSVGATKGTIYHYFEDKTQLVVESYKRAFGIYQGFIDTAHQNGDCGFNQAIIVHHLNCQAQYSDHPPLMLQSGVDALPHNLQSEFVSEARSLWQQVQAMTEQGVKDGSCRPGDMAFLTEVAAGSFAWLGKSESRMGLGSLSSFEAADTICRMIAFGIED